MREDANFPDQSEISALEMCHFSINLMTAIGWKFVGRLKNWQCAVQPKGYRLPQERFGSVIAFSRTNVHECLRCK